MGHTMIYTQSHIRERHTGNILRHSHAVPTDGILRVFYGDRQIAIYHLNGFNLEHIRQFPCTLRDKSLYSMRHSIHTRRSRKRLRQRIHQFGIHDSHVGNIVGIYANHLSLTSLIDDNIVDGCLGSCARCCGQCYDGERLLLGICHALQGNNIRELRVIHHNANSLGCVHTGTAPDCYNKVSPRLLAGLYTALHIRNGRIRFHIIEYLVADASLIHYIEHHLGNAKLHQALVCYYQRLLKAKASYYSWQLLASPGTEV